MQVIYLQRRGVICITTPGGKNTLCGKRIGRKPIRVKSRDKLFTMIPHCGKCALELYEFKRDLSTLTLVRDNKRG